MIQQGEFKYDCTGGISRLGLSRELTGSVTRCFLFMRTLSTHYVKYVKDSSGCTCTLRYIILIFLASLQISLVWQTRARPRQFNKPLRGRQLCKAHTISHRPPRCCQTIPLPAYPRNRKPSPFHQLHPKTWPPQTSARSHVFNNLAPPAAFPWHTSPTNKLSAAATTTERRASSSSLSSVVTELDSMTEKARESERTAETAVPEKPMSVFRSKSFRACSNCRLKKVSRLPSLSSELADLCHRFVVTMIQKINGSTSRLLSL